MTQPNTKGANTLTAKDVLFEMEGLINCLHGRAAIVDSLIDLRFVELCRHTGHDAANESMRAESVAVGDLMGDVQRLVAKLIELQEVAGIVTRSGRARLAVAAE